mmetsp:Transcript_28527/g.42701  ORF Transcript_28527/g.42701 Transcript_28527/m.42701 type:complete len:87 (+) Transcript_28527:64-324(+)
MTSVVELFPKSQKLSYDSRQQLSQVQNGVMHASELFLSLEELNNQQKFLELRKDANSICHMGQYYNCMVTAGVQQRQEQEELMWWR